MPTKTTAIDHLVVALLSVGGYPLQRTWDRLEKLQKEGLTDPAVMSALDEAETVRRLARAGYDRGPDVTTSMARRLIAVHGAIREGILERTLVCLASKKPNEARALLCNVKGIGPAVFENFAALEGSQEELK